MEISYESWETVETLRLIKSSVLESSDLFWTSIPPGLISHFMLLLHDDDDEDEDEDVDDNDDDDEDVDVDDDDLLLLLLLVPILPHPNPMQNLFAINFPILSVSLFLFWFVGRREMCWLIFIENKGWYTYWYNIIKQNYHMY